MEEAGALPDRPGHLAIGMFDGVHLGHRAVIESAIHSAAAEGGQAGVLTFNPHPSRLLRPEQPTRLLMPIEVRRQQLSGLGLDFIIEQEFDRAFASIEAEAFPVRLKESMPWLTTLYIGETWRFGAGRKGTVDQLIKWGRPLGLGVVSARRIHHNGQPISSTRIRSLVEAGDVAQAAVLLGYRYFAQSRVRSGKRLGRTVGFPTLNLPWEPEHLPAFGVYVVRVRRTGEPPSAGRPGVANFGLRPTVETSREPLLEVHCLEDCPFGYGDELIAEWLAYLRPEQRFDGPDALCRQIAQDRDAAAAWFAQRRRDDASAVST
ncbi:MAG: riboflavin biosynthesis protein RibF [Puniceicoccaceae bacterium]|nr:MAG: riboflavin biosynthesis protein RibF [Puniceicoccaceae bacterium]